MRTLTKYEREGGNANAAEKPSQKAADQTGQAFTSVRAAAVSSKKQESVRMEVAV